MVTEIGHVDISRNATQPDVGSLRGKIFFPNVTALLFLLVLASFVDSGRLGRKKSRRHRRKFDRRNLLTSEIAPVSSRLEKMRWLS